MKKNYKVILGLVFVLVSILALACPAFAQEAQEAGAIGAKAIGSGIGIGLAAAGGAIGMGIGIAKAMEGISRQPEAESKIRTTLMLGLVFVETAIIYALVIAILVIFVL